MVGGVSEMAQDVGMVCGYTNVHIGFCGGRS